MYSMEKVRQERLTLCEKGLKGEYQLPITSINALFTDKCNLNCIMCNSKPLLNKGHSMTLDDHKAIFMCKKDLEFFSRNPFTYDPTSGEPLCNRESYEIFKFLKMSFPSTCRIHFVSNGTIPPHMDITRYIDSIGFSIDGGTKDVFEKIRVPAKFENTKTTIHKWVENRSRYNPKMQIYFHVTLSALNIHDLSSIVRLMYELTHKTAIGRINVDDCLVDELDDKLKKALSLEYVCQHEAIASIERASATAGELGVKLNIPQGISERIYARMSKKNDASLNCLPEAVPLIKFCATESLCNALEPWGGGIKIGKDLKGIGYICCQMRNKEDALLKYGINLLDLRETGLVNFYNQAGLWHFRKDLLLGRANDFCGGCIRGQEEFFRIRAMDEKIYNELMKDRGYAVEKPMNCDKDKADAVERLHYIENSFSWRITSPLRRIRKFISKKNRTG